jgi:DNA-binding GntR family transcriptional regulator
MPAQPGFIHPPEVSVLMRLVHNSLHERVAATLREEIFGGMLAPGSFIDEAVLCERLKISRTPLREALKVLSAEGLVRHEPRRGCFVNEVTEQDLDEIFPVIALLEGRCAFEAARNASDTDLAVLQTLHDKLLAHAEARRIVDYYQTNHAIHEAIITLANNRWLAQVIGDLRKILKLARLQGLHAPGRLAVGVVDVDDVGNRTERLLDLRRDQTPRLGVWPVDLGKQRRDDRRPRRYFDHLERTTRR